MTQDTAVGDPHPSQIERLAFVRYLVSVGRTQVELPEPTAASALLTFHDAVELFLQLAAEHLHVQMRFPKDHFVDYWPKLEQAGKPMPFSEAMKRLNDARVSLKHRGVLPRRSDLVDFGVIVPDFLQQATRAVFGFEIETVSLSVLVADTVARAELQDAERAVSEERLPDALKASALSFDSLVGNYESRAAGHRYQSPFKASSSPHSTSFRHYMIRQRSKLRPATGRDELQELTQELERAFESLWDAMEGTQDALRIVLLGLDYRRYVRFSSVTPSVHHMMSGPRHVSPMPTGSLDDAKFSIEFVIESALRLQAFDVVPGHPPA
jgi:hypothetical protein